MSNTETNNPQAFPTLGSTNSVDSDGRETALERHYNNPGMTLRDYFAGQIAAGMVANPRTAGDPGAAKTVAKYAYAIADALLHERR